MGYKTPFQLQPDETCIDYETDVRTDNLKVNDAYDLYLIAKGKPIREYKLICYMNLQLFFQRKGGAWTELEKKDFVNQWEKNVKSAWDRKLLRTLSNGIKVILEFKFNYKLEGFWLYDHWEISATKTKNFEQSYVNTFSGNSQLDDKDFVMTQKPRGLQRGAVHEFGHMLGLKDEYKKNGVWYNDSVSVMNNGEVIRGRHLADFANWVDKKLLKYKIK